MKWGEDPDPENADEDDIAEFDKMRKASPREKGFDHGVLKLF